MLHERRWRGELGNESVGQLEGWHPDGRAPVATAAERREQTADKEHGWPFSGWELVLHEVVKRGISVHFFDI
jgi:hypothetical protein